MPRIWRDYHASNEPGTCLWCGKPLPYWIAGKPEHGRGYGGTGHFCTVRCGFNFAERWAELGKRFTPAANEEE